MRALVKMIDYCWRLIGTGLSFAVFGIGSLTLGFVIVPLISIFVRDADKRLMNSRLAVGAAMKWFIRFMCIVGVLRYKIKGLQNVRSDRSYLVIANHPSLIDVIFLLSVFPTSDCVIKPQLKKNFFTRRLMESVEYISSGDTSDWLEVCIDRLKSGRSLILFPEGTRTIPGLPISFKAGAASIAVRSGCNCLPVLINCEPTTLTKSESWYQVPDRRVEFSMQVQPAFSVSDIMGEPENFRAAGRSFNEYLLQYFKIRQKHSYVDIADVNTAGNTYTAGG